MISVRAHSPASAADLYALLASGETWPAWSPIGSFELERPGVTAEGGGDGVGAIRIFRTGRVTSRERVVELVPDRRLTYALESGLPLRDYQGVVELTPDATGTAISWRSRFRPAIPGTGWLYDLILGRFIQRCADGLAAYRPAP